MLRVFIARAHPDDTCELAGLNYWAYWVGEIDQPQRDDTFMVGSTWTWRGDRLLRHLTGRLNSDHDLIDLNIHSLWALLTIRPNLALDDRELGSCLLDRTARLLDAPVLSPQSRRELMSVTYGLRASGLARKD